VGSSKAVRGGARQDEAGQGGTQWGEAGRGEHTRPARRMRRLA